MEEMKRRVEMILLHSYMEGKMDGFKAADVMKWTDCGKGSVSYIMKHMLSKGYANKSGEKSTTQYYLSSAWKKEIMDHDGSLKLKESAFINPQKVKKEVSYKLPDGTRVTRPENLPKLNTEDFRSAVKLVGSIYSSLDSVMENLVTEKNLALEENQFLREENSKLREENDDLKLELWECKAQLEKIMASKQALINLLQQ